MPAALQTRPAAERRSTRSNSPGSGPGDMTGWVLTVRTIFVKVIWQRYRLLCLTVWPQAEKLLSSLSYYCCSSYDVEIARSGHADDACDVLPMMRVMVHQCKLSSSSSPSASWSSTGFSVVLLCLEMGFAQYGTGSGSAG